MLPADSRLKDRVLIARTVRGGSRAGRRYVVVHYLAEQSSTSAQSVNPHQPARVAFAVSKSVGGSVVRHRVVRRLRHILAAHLSELPVGCSIVVRALPAAGTATSADLANDIGTLLRRFTVVGT